ncbi:hypothetical protein DFH27DRAFT_505737 [Peziza echinospora]|nr:hypothetical protein DFH27DRAFT_505737 [Peziza echinospora]
MPSFTALTRALVLVLAFAAAAVTAAPAELPTSPAEARAHLLGAIEEAKGLGIDIAGPIPDDYTKFDAETGRYEFAGGSKAGAWARAQLAASALEEGGETSGLQKRASGVGLGMWTGTWCSGSGWYIPDMNYGTTYFSPSTAYISVGISGRSLGNWEQLDFSTWTTCPTHGCSPVACGQYLYSAGTYTPPGCWNSMSYTCAKLWLY